MKPVEIAILAHASLGGLALLSGVFALSSRKGSKPHINSGKVFYYSMMLSVAISIVISLLPGHTNPFLFAIGCFSLYLVLSGRRVLKITNSPTTLDYLISGTMLFLAAAMIINYFYPFFLSSGSNLVLLIFGGIGLTLSARDFNWYKKPKELLKNRIRLHLIKMTGGYIAATTAFFVVNEILPGIWGWITPTIIGSILISYWTRKGK